MKKKLIILLISITLYSNAQHCPYDLSGIIVLNIHSKNSTAIIPNLKITLLDSLNNVVMANFWRKEKHKGGNFVKDTLKFWQNPSKTTFGGYIDNNNPADDTRIRFPFAKENYVLVGGYDFKIQNYKIKIEDVDGRKNQGRFKTTIIRPKQIKVYSLCGKYNLERYPGDFQPTEVILK